ncbi:hypothetical protein ZWY2020_011750 [Hordeum vulgare]|nr:hypothetical protein ZWY2020_011750 [Hordeum vulgare]
MITGGSDSMDPYVILTAAATSRRAPSHQEQEASLEWNETFVFAAVSGNAPSSESRSADSDAFSADDLVGEAWQVLPQTHLL